MSVTPRIVVFAMLTAVTIVTVITAVGASSVAGVPAGAEIPIADKKKQSNSDETSGDDCHPSYTGCLKRDASDYDCAGGSGNGPYYTGRVRVIGPDVFKLDSDGDGWACE